MKSSIMSVDELVNNSEIGFSDSEGMIEDKRVDGEISEDEYRELFATMDSSETKQRVLDWKLEECSDSFIESIRENGIKASVAILDSDVANGHHRIAVAQFLGIDVPVQIYDSWDEFESDYEWENGLIDCFGQQEL